jgi:hypothetical protein
MKPALLCSAVVAGAMFVAMRPEFAEQWTMWAVLVASYGALGALASYRLYRTGALGECLRFRSGDMTIGIVLGLLLTGTALVAKRVIAPAGSAPNEWLFQLYAQLGNVHKSPALVGAVAFIGLAEEVVWRGWVLRALQTDLGARRAAPLSALAFGLAHLPTVWTLRGAAGLNPALVFASLGAGLIWAFVATFLGRLWPVILSHVVFSYFLASPLSVLG